MKFPREQFRNTILRSYFQIRTKILSIVPHYSSSTIEFYVNIPGTTKRTLKIMHYNSNTIKQIKVGCITSHIQTTITYRMLHSDWSHNFWSYNDILFVFFLSIKHKTIEFITLSIPCKIR